MEKNPKNSKITVVLKTYKGHKLSYNEDGTVQNQNQLVKIEYNTNEWRAVMNNLALSGFAKVEVVKAFYLDENETEIKDLSIYEEEVEKHYKPTPKVAETPQDKKIAELEAKLEALLNGGKKEDVVTEDKDEKELLRMEYEELSGKNVFNGWNVDQLKEKITELKK